jgi:hypothetical protein
VDVKGIMKLGQLCSNLEQAVRSKFRSAELERVKALIASYHQTIDDTIDAEKQQGQ